MLDWNKLLTDLSILTVAFVLIVLYMAKFKPRLFLNKEDVPADILAAVPPKTAAEKRESIFYAIPLFVILIGGTLYSTYTFQQQSGAGFFPVFLHAAIIILTISTFDLVFIDWLLLNTWTPKWVMFPGTEGFAGYKDYGFHGRAHLRVLPAQIIGAAVCAGIVMLLAAIS
jgi:hypothetical protein